MPVTKTAKRALRSSKRKAAINKLILTKLSTTIRLAKKEKTLKTVIAATSLADKASKRHIIHKNKRARIKSALSRLVKSSPRKTKQTPQN